MTSTSLSVRLTSLFDAHRQTLHLIARLSKLPIQPGSSSLNPGDGDARVELSAEIHQNLKEQEEELELLRQEVEDLTSTSSWGGNRRRDSQKERERTDLAAQVARLGEDLKLARTQFRKAQLQAKRNAENAKRKERELLFAGIQEGDSTSGNHRRKGKEKLSQDELLVYASSDVTAALRRTHQMMQSELSRSQFAHDTLEQSTAALSTLSESYTNLDTLLSSSRSLLSSLLRSQKSDTWYLETAFYLLLSTIIWLIFRRLFYGPLWWFVWLPIKVAWKLSVGLLASLGIIGGAASQSSSSLVRGTGTSLIVQPSATGGFPRFSPGMSAPSIVVGGGGRGAAGPPPNQASRSEEGSMSEQVGKMAEESQEHQQDGERQGGPDDSTEIGRAKQKQQQQPRNPKKRMWEEDVEAKKFEERKKDEL
ncbi:MAG: hypothetical protein M1830_007636 [Pleopsidium flavum]|nr:MAG: hypothetical protein M1830_007636 [Pleopsidium flavum]